MDIPSWVLHYITERFGSSDKHVVLSSRTGEVIRKVQNGSSDGRKEKERIRKLRLFSTSLLFL